MPVVQEAEEEPTSTFDSQRPRDLKN